MASLSDKAGFLIGANLVKYAVGFITPMVLVRMLFLSWVGVLAYTFQIYFDFSGYSDMASQAGGPAAVTRFWRRWGPLLNRQTPDHCKPRHSAACGGGTPPPQEARPPHCWRRVAH